MHFLERAWYRKSGWLLLLWPLAILFQLIVWVRKKLLSARAKNYPSPVPVIVIGNISVGGTGKTPLVISLTQALISAGLKPGVISRGYGSSAPAYPFDVSADISAATAGDEALLIAKSLKCPVVIDPDRPRALDYICKQHSCDVVLSDDGLQHYALPRSIEIAVVDGIRLFGNGMCLPAGPLREPVSRLDSVDHIVINGETGDTSGFPQLTRATTMSLEPTYLINMVNGEKKPFKGAPFNMGTRVHAVSGIGNPQRFYDVLDKLPYELEIHEFPDHHPFSKEDIDKLGIDEHQPVVMTEKDAVKCREFAEHNYWYLAVRNRLDEAFLKNLVNRIKALCETGSA